MGSIILLHLLLLHLLLLLTLVLPAKTADDDEVVEIHMQEPTHGKWRPSVAVSLNLELRSGGALAERMRSTPDAFSVCYTGGLETSCHAITSSQTLPSIFVKEPSAETGHVATVTAWLQEERQPNDFILHLDNGRPKAVLWNNTNQAVTSLRSRLDAILASEDKEGQPEEEVQLLRSLLETAMEDEHEVVRSQLGSFVKSVGFGTYGLEHAAFHFWGSSNARIKFGRFCAFATAVEFFLDGNHLMGGPSTFPFQELGGELGFPGMLGYLPAVEAGRSMNTGKGAITFGSDVWVGKSAVFLSGVTVGHGAVVATRAVVTRDVPPYAVVAGNPARVVRRRFNDTVVERLLELQWWNWSHERIGGVAGLLGGGDIDAFLLALEEAAPS